MTDSTLPDSRIAGAELDAPAADQHAGRNRLVINILIVSAFVVILNETIMGVALPHLMADFEITANAAQWLTTAFMLTMAVVIPITGFLIQRFHTRQIFMAAMALFSLGTLVAALAPGFEVLLAARVVQALGTAIMMPLLMTTVMTLVPPQTRGRTMGNISIVISVAPAIGPTISGLILSALSWRFMFIIVLPIAVAALVVGAMKIQNVTEPKQVPIDVPSIILSAFAFGGLVYGLSSMGDSSGAGVPAWIPLTVGGLALAAFVIRQLVLQRTDRALLDLRTFMTRTFTVSVLMFAISMMALFGTIILLPLYMQEVLHLDTLASGLLLLPGGLLMGLLSPVVGRLYDRFGPRPLLIPGSIVLSAVLWSLTQVTETTPVWMVLIAHVFLSAALAFMFTPLFTASLGSLRPSLYSHGSAVVGTVQQVAGAAGTALFISVMSVVAASQQATGVDGTVAQAHGIATAFTYGAVISLFGIVAAFFVRRPADSPGGPAMGH